jgi:hypothetical protein
MQLEKGRMVLNPREEGFVKVSQRIVVCVVQ